MSSISSSTSGLNFTGLATGIDTEKIVNGLTSLTQKRVDKFRQNQIDETTKQTVFAGLRGKVGALQGALGKLSRSFGGAFEGRKITTSDNDAITGVGSSSALAGSYNIRVNQLAQANQVGSTALSDQTTSIKTGTVAIKVGAGEAINVTIDSTNNTLQGLANAINDANGDVRASVVNDSSGFRLLMTATKTGAANTISVTNNLTGGSGASVDLLDRQIQGALDSQVSLGSGPGAITVNNATNRVDNLITGVSMNLTKADPSKTITLNVSTDTETATKAIDEFVAAYNDVIDFIDQRDDYDQQTRTAGMFLGNRDVADLKNELSNALGSTVGGVNPKLNRMSAIGLTTDAKGKLAFDASQMNKALNGEVQGVNANDVKRLFAMTGTSTNGSVTFLLGSSKTKPTVGNQAYQVNVTNAATRANISGNLLSPTTVFTTANNSFGIKVNSLSTATITIDPGTYTQAQVASAIQVQLNGRFGNGTATVELDGGALRFSSAQFGTSSKIELTGGTAASVLGFSGTESSVGTNVQGSFIVNGVTEAATGIGQVLSGNGDNANTSGLQVRVGLTQSQLNSSGNEADLTVTRGIASRVSQALDRFTDPVNGRFKNIDDRFKRSIEGIETTITRENTQLEAKKNSLLLRFTGVESTVNQLKNVGNQITASFGVLSFR